MGIMESTTLTHWALTTEHPVAVMGTGGEFELVPLLSSDPLPETFTSEMRARRFHLCGILGIRAGVPDAKVEKDPDSLYTVLMATLAYAQQVADEIKRKGNGGDGDGVDWLEQLHQLPDPRES